MDINQLKHFISAAQTLNFSEAARRNGLTQPSISHNIGELEKHLGARLFLRSRRSVSLTSAGNAFLPYALEMVETAERAAFQIKQLASGSEGHISITALTTSSAALSRCLSKFSSDYPQIMVDITITSGRNQVIATNEPRHEFHFVVREMVPEGDAFSFIPTHTDRLCLAVPKNHWLTSGPVDLSVLAGERYISVSESDGPALYDQIMRVCAARGYDPNITCRYDRAEAVLLSVGANLGISIIPEAICKVFYAENVRYFPIPGDDALRTYVLAWRRDISSPTAELFLETAKSLFT